MAVTRREPYPIEIPLALDDEEMIPLPDDSSRRVEPTENAFQPYRTGGRSQR